MTRHPSSGAPTGGAHSPAHDAVGLLYPASDGAGRAAEGAASPIDVVVVSHTHWDREWHQPFQTFRYRLVQVVDQVLDLLAADPAFRHFTLDGQTIVLEDYLALRPGREAELRQHIASGRLLVGPWHVLPDELLVSGESMVRNLLLGWTVGQRFGGSMRVGYVPDMFGHVGQLPQLLALCGMNAAVFRRGLGDEPTELWWQAPDGTRVLAIYLRDGYGNAAHLPTDPCDFVRAVGRQVMSLVPHTATRHVLLMNGDDQRGPQASLPALVAAANTRMAGVRLRHGTLPQFVDAVRRDLGLDGRGTGGSTLPVVQGELRSPERHLLLAGVLSARLWIKQRNAACETALTRYAEPLAAIGRLLDGRDQRQALWQAWRPLVENHAHDSICGCSVDQVHEEMKTRFASSAQLAEAVAGEGLQTLARRVASRPAPRGSRTPGVLLRLHADRPPPSAVVFNPARGPRTGHVSVEAPGLLPGQTYRLLDGVGCPVRTTPIEWHRRLLVDRRIEAAEIAELLEQVEGGWLIAGAVADARLRRRQPSEAGRGDVADLELVLVELAQPDIAAIYRFTAAVRRLLAEGRLARCRLRAWLVGPARFAFMAQNVPAFGYQGYQLEVVPGRTRPPEPAPPPVGSRAIENELFRVEASALDGTLTLVDKRTGVRFAGLNRLVDGGDRGDLYSYCAPGEDRVVDRPAAPPRIAVRDEGPVGQRLDVRMVYAVPRRLARDRRRRAARLMRLPVASRVWLRPGVARVEIETTVENRAEDHRLRVLFPTPFWTEQALAESAFDVVARPLGLPTQTAGWAEQPVATAPQGTFVAVQDGGRGLLVANQGLPEYEVIPSPGGATIALTLLRCVGWLSRDDLTCCRPAPAGPGLPTPGAQCPGGHTFAYALVPFVAPLSSAIHEAYAFRAPLRAAVAAPGEASLPPRLSFVELNPEELVVSAVKPAEDGEGWVVRFWNTQERPATARLTVGFAIGSAERVDLLERPLAPVDVRDSRIVQMGVRGKEIVSLRLRPTDRWQDPAMGATTEKVLRSSYSASPGVFRGALP